MNFNGLEIWKGKTHDTVQEPEFEQRKQSLEDTSRSSEKFGTCELEQLLVEEGSGHDLPTCKGHNKVLEATNSHEILQALHSKKMAVRLFPLVPKPTFQSYQPRRDSFQHAYDPEKALPPLPPQLPNHESRAVEIHDLQHDQEYRVGSEEGLKRNTRSYHDKTPTQSHSSLSERTATTSRESFWGALLERILFLYGDSGMGSDLNRGFNNTPTSYPHGLRLFLTLLSGALPYVVVSCL